MRISLCQHTAGGQGVFRPQLTSLVDVMTILLVFLIKSFSVENAIVTPADDLHLPVSTSEKPPRVRCSITVTRNAIMVEGEVIVTFNKMHDDDSLLIPVLFTYMKSQYQRSASARQHAEVILQCDREVKYAFVKKVMYTSSKAGFTDFSVLVLQEGG